MNHPSASLPRRVRLLTLAVALGTVGTALLAPPAQADDSPSLNRLLFETAAPAAAKNAPGAALGPGAGDSSEPIEAESEADLQRHVLAASLLEAEQGPFSAALAEQLTALARLQEARGLHQNAIASYERAMHILRVNEGLFTLRQVPVVEGIVRNHEALDESEEADARQEYLYYLKLKNYPDGAPERQHAKLERANSLLLGYQREIAARSAPGLRVSMSSSLGRTDDYIPVYGPNGQVIYMPRDQLFGSGSMAPPLSEESAMPLKLRRARELLREVFDDAAADSTLRKASAQGLANVAWLRQLELAGGDGGFGRGSLYQNRPPAMLPLSRSFNEGRDALEEVVDRLREADAVPPEALATALTDLGDWYLAHGRLGSANAHYGQAWDVLEAAGRQPQAISAFFAPAPALPLPRFAPHPYSRASLGLPAAGPVDYQGHIDVGLQVDRQGRVDEVEVLERSPDTPEKVARALLEWLEEARLRPAIRDGETVDGEMNVVRYFYAY